MNQFIKEAPELKSLHLQKFRTDAPAYIDAEIELSILKATETGIDKGFELKHIKKVFKGERKTDDETGSIWLFLTSLYKDDFWFYVKIAIHKP